MAVKRKTIAVIGTGDMGHAAHDALADQIAVDGHVDGLPQTQVVERVRASIRQVLLKAPDARTKHRGRSRHAAAPAGNA